MHKVKCTCPSGIQLRLLGGTVYLKPGQEAVLTDTQITHSTVKVAIKNGYLQTEPVVVAPAAIVEPVVEPAKKEKVRHTAKRTEVESEE